MLLIQSICQGQSINGIKQSGQNAQINTANVTEAFTTEASMDPPNVAVMFTWLSCFMLTCRGITRHDDMKYVNMNT